MSDILAESPLAPKKFPLLAAVKGVKLVTGNSGTKYQGRDDLLLVVLPEGTALAGAFTKSATASAPVLWCREQMAASGGRAQALVVNAGNANAFTGAAGFATVQQMASAASQIAHTSSSGVMVASTGVIGEPLNGEKICSAIAGLGDELADASGALWQRAADAIRTTDTFAKGAGAALTIDGHEVKIAAIAKGSGMIAPDMATMLGFVFTDAAIAPQVLQKCLSQAVADSFNSITVDSDTSTSDTVLAFATAQAGHDPITDAADRRLAAFRRALRSVCLDLAHQVVRDGEGASKFVSVTVSGAKSKRSAKRVALAIANSPLVKTAVAGEDPNWGRIIMAVGKSGEPAERDLLAISIGGIKVTEGGRVVADYDEAPVAEHMKCSEVDIAVDLGLGRGRATVWTCDLTHQYIAINVDYRS